MRNSGTIRIGIGGWVYPPWRGAFYPAGLRQAEELAFASRHVTAIEINGTFYRIQTPASFRKWRDETPDDFVFSLKGPRFLTHRNELASAAPYIDRFLDSGLADLKQKLGPILWQFAPSKQFDAADLAAFLDLLPHERSGTPLRHVIEARHSSFQCPEFFDLLRRRGAAVALVDDANHPEFDELTADFAYLRLRRCAQKEETGYPPAALDRWAERLRAWSEEGRDCFLYFINGAKVRAPAAAQALLARL
ncbi:MAG TPA: DUF72 domain-containing protein [Stellaceae bacterium]|jgi:uncharacterized protein YecE (DUF72 family)|nr:DUF72 domain-containing protein [Stellaceae bacterium]